MRTLEQIAEGYSLYRGKCLEFVEEICRLDPTLTIKRGHYFCFAWGSNEPHWWAVKPDGTIVDPTKAQFPCNGNGVYEEFDGICSCEECGKEFEELDGVSMGNYMVCSSLCARRLVGL